VDPLWQPWCRLSQGQSRAPVGRVGPSRPPRARTGQARFIRVAETRGQTGRPRPQWTKKSSGYPGRWRVPGPLAVDFDLGGQDTDVMEPARCRGSRRRVGDGTDGGCQDHRQGSRPPGGTGERSALAPEKARIAARAEDEVRGADAEGVVAAVADDLGARERAAEDEGRHPPWGVRLPAEGVEQGGTVGQGPAAAIARLLPAPAGRASGESAGAWDGRVREGIEGRGHRAPAKGRSGGPSLPCRVSHRSRCG
jgi:hypothetical protein